MDKKRIDVHCQYCKYRGNEEELREMQYIYDIQNGKTKIFECPKCEQQQILND